MRSSMATAAERTGRQILGRYALFDEIASGGMAVVHLGRLLGAGGFSRPVAIKRLHPQFSRDPEFASMFLDEARLAAHVRHPNVVATMDVVAMEGELVLVLEYVHGESLSGLARAAREQGERVPPALLVSIVSGALHGLHAAHEAKSEAGEPLCIVHRDVSPQNVMVGVDGIARVLDFGVAKAAVRSQTTREGQLKGKLKYMAPEQLRGREVTRTADVYSAGVVLWEALTGERLFTAESEAALFGKILEGVVVPPSKVLATIPKGLDEVVLRALERDPARRYATASEMAAELEAALAPAAARDVGDWVQRTAGPALADRAACLARIDAGEEPPLSHPPPKARAPGHTSTTTHTETANHPPPPSVPVTPPLSTPPPSASAVRAVQAASQQDTASGHAAAAPREPARSGSRWPVVGVGAVLLLAASIAFASRSSAPLVLAEARTGVGAAITQEATLAAVTSEHGPASESGAPAGTAGAANPTPRYPHGRVPPGARSAAASAAPAPSADRPPRPNCDPPTYEDANGIRRVKRECLE